MNSILTALVTGKRNALSPKRIVQLGWMRMVLRGKHARAPRWRRKRKADKVPAAGMGAGAGAGAGGGGAFAPIFNPPSAAPEIEFEAIEIVDDGTERDLLPVVLNALIDGDSDEDLDIDLELALATDAAVVEEDDCDAPRA